LFTVKIRKFAIALLDPTTPQVCRFTTLCLLWKHITTRRFVDRAIAQCCRRLQCVVQRQGVTFWCKKTALCDSYIRQ